MKRYFTTALPILSGITLFLSCKKEFDHPPLIQPNDGAKLYVNALKARVPSASSSYHFGAGDTNLYATVLADESSGNIYKQSFVMDDNGGCIQLNLRYAGGLAVGDKIRINLNKLWMVNANNMVYIDSVDMGKNVVKLSSGSVVTPKTVLLSEVLAGTVPTNSNSLQSQLVRIDNSEFIEKGQPFADAIGKASLNRTLKTCGSSSTLTVRTSGYANFASKNLPSGNGYIIAIVTQYNSTMQLTIRDYNEVQMNNASCPPPTFTLGTPVPSINENFNTVTSGQTYSNTGWINLAEVGNAKWKTDVSTSGTITAKTLKATAFGSGDANNSMWIITPPVIYTSTMTLSFKTAFGFWDNGHPNAIMAYVSTNYNGGNLNTANWTAISSASYANGTGSFYPTGFTNSGTINLNSIGILNGYSGNFFVAWKYTGTAGTYDSNIYLDDILIQ